MLTIFYPFPWYFQTTNLNVCVWGGSSWIIFFYICSFSSFWVSFSICFIHLLIWEYKNVNLLMSEALTILFTAISTVPKIQRCLVLVGVKYMCRNEGMVTKFNWLIPWFVCTVDLPLIDSLISVLQNMEHCQKKPENSVESNAEETKKFDLTQEDFHLKILKDISCEFLSNIFQVLTKVGEEKKRNTFFLFSAKESMDCFLLSNFIVSVFIF